MSVIINGDTGITTPAETVQGALTTTGNTILGDASTDTLNVGAGGLVKDASGNVGIGTASPQSLLDLTGNDPTIRFTDNAGSPTATWSIRSGDANFSVRSVTAGADRMVVDSSGNLQFNSGYGSAATAYGCRAWVNFNGTGTVAIRASGNVSSITDNGVGFYTVNFTTALVDANYTAVANTAIEGTYAASSACSSTTNTASGAVISVTDYNGPARCDQNGIYINIFR
jgi:hypothetical protein